MARIIEKPACFLLAAVILLLLAVYSPAGYRIEYRYDSLDRLAKVIHPSGETVIYSYDAVGNRTRKTVTVMPSPDINHSGRVDFVDFGILSKNWLSSGSNLQGDLNHSGTVDIHDLKIIADHWLENI